MALSPPVVPPAEPGVVPWSDRPAPPEPAAVYPGPPRAPVCHPDQLRLAAEQGQGLGFGSGLIAGIIRLTNVGSSACSLVGSPRSASVVTAAGRTVAVAVRTTDQFDGPNADLQPGDQARLNVTYSAAGLQGCTLGPALRALRLTLPAGGTVVLPHPPFPVVNCPSLTVNRFSVDSALAPIPLPIDALTVTVHVPDTVRAGTVLAYTVTLTNPTDHPISLSPCPGYWAHGFVNGESVVHDQLNCDGLAAIASHAAATFAMRIAVPPVADPGAPLYWHLDTPSYQDGGAPGSPYREASAGIVVTAPTTPGSS